MKRIDRVVVSCVAASAVLLTAARAVGADPSPAAEADQWGPEYRGLRTRLVPLEKQFVLGQPMRFRLEMKNVGQHKATYDRPHVYVNNPFAVRDPQGNHVLYIGFEAQMGPSDRPSLAPGSTIILVDNLDLTLQYFIAKPGKYTVKFPGSNTLVIDVQPGPLPPAFRVAVRLRDILPKDWKLTGVHAKPSKTAPPGWETGSSVFSVNLFCSLPLPHTKRPGVGALVWISDRKLPWTGKVDYPGWRAAYYLGKCPEGYVYASLPTDVEAYAANWFTMKEDIEKALQTVPKYPLSSTGGVKNDDDLAHLDGLRQLDILWLDHTKITDAGLRHLKGLTQLKYLWLSDTQVTDTGLQYIKGLTKLERLSLDNTKITGAGLENLKGLTRLESLALHETQITDAGLANLKGLAQLHSLSLDDTQITDAGLEHLTGLTQLHGLSLGGTRITDAGLEHLEGLPQLEGLSLDNTKITDAGLEHLKGLTQLRKLSLDKTHVTDEGVGKLQQALPRCEFIY
jgi:Leucine-rich repeat (LRR) protein